MGISFSCLLFVYEHINKLRYVSIGVFSVFTSMLQQPTPPLHSLNTAVDPTTTIMDICEAVCHHKHVQCHTQGTIYLMGCWRSLRAHETMLDLGVYGLRYFIITPRLLGNASVRKDGVVVNEHGWEQCATNPDGTLKEPEGIDFGPDPDAPPAPT
ncbi:hypothetical protein B0H14DRAFT_2582465 [Mycena olivaceomarginata]|nr:hypothetical protein B0H14DRAFT_2582465 [Mycena olivaceomarginata]